MYGVDWSTPSSTIALCCAYCRTVFRLWSADLPARPATRLPRSYSSFVMRWNSFAPWLVKPSTTSG
jgi:hypothetical protein